MNEATALWEQEGTAVARSKMWDSQEGESVFNQMTRVMNEQEAPIRYTVFKDGNHMYTWSLHIILKAFVIGCSRRARVPAY